MRIGDGSLKLRDRRDLQRRFFKIVFSFEDEFDDASAKEGTRNRKANPRPKRHLNQKEIKKYVN